MQIRLGILSLSLTLSFSCATSTKLPPEIASTLSEPGIETIVILGTNDIHGALAPHTLRTRETDGTTPVEYEAGGAAYLASHIRILRDQFGSRLLWLDAGDEFQGSIESNLEKGAPMVKFFNASGVHGAAVGNHEFDFGPESTATPAEAGDVLGALKARMKEANYPYLAANIVDRKTGRLAEFPNTPASRIYSVGSLKVGVIGLSTLETPRTTRPDYVQGLEFTDLKEATLREAGKLRESGADLIIITAHVGLKCEGPKGPPALALRKPTDAQGSCGEKDEMVRFLRALPEGTVDAVVSGHSHQLVHHWVGGVPVIQGGAFGRYYNLIYLVYDKREKKLLRDRTRIEGPVPVCPAVFKNQNDCNGDRAASKEGRGSLVTPLFHGQRIKADPLVLAQLESAFARSAEAKKKVVGQAARPLEHERLKESPLGSLVADSLRAAGNADFALMNGGGVRARIEEGEITFEEVFRTLPFDNAVSLLTLTGRQLKSLLRVAQSGSRGFVSLSGLRVTLIDPAYEAPSSDLNGDRRIEPWEINRLIEVKAVRDGKAVPIQDDKQYTLATLDFLVTGGDDLDWAIAQIPESRIQFSVGVTMRDAFLRYIADRGPLNTVEQPLVDPANPRLVFSKSQKGTRKKPGRRRARRS